MFSKATSKAPAATPQTPASRQETSAAASDPAPAARKSPKAASLIANDIVIEGNMVGEGELHVDGFVRGDVRVLRLSVGETGRIEGSIIAEAVDNRGRVVGSITAKQVRLMGTAFVDGDITHEQLTMEAGAFFQGRSLKFQRPAPAPAPAVAAPTAAPKSVSEVVDISAAS